MPQPSSASDHFPDRMASLTLLSLCSTFFTAVLASTPSPFPPVSPHHDASNAMKIVKLKASSDVDTILQRRIAGLTSGWDPASLTSSVASALSTVRDDFTWAAVNYASGCDAQRSNWPAQVS